MSELEEVTEQINFSVEEVEILQWWREHKIFAKSLEFSNNLCNFVFQTRYSVQKTVISFIFKTQGIICVLINLRMSKNRTHYTFYDGPPFATGLPHYGHILAGTIKDVVTRWAHQNGYYVERRFGWDTHGLPVECEVDKILGIKNPRDVLELGIDRYNAECRKVVMRYSAEWEVCISVFCM
ncbi:unnamed protein product [Thelazia callipaeda]|uniref:tRNA-synt_1 domain-containing protein n=1 Tax=Thelazia callipaeda TaxID=103827 RepID=A0A0N5CT94_THECL|nr:unnamed protein product [Thelazia callipaeda]